ncbi:MAG: translocation/assembly module TamB domain-containing protein [Candidatus Eisenbacteria bacterium]
MNTAPPSAPGPGRVASTLERVIRGLLRTVLIVVVALAGTVTALIETPAGLRMTAGFALRIVRPFPGLESEVGGARGGALTGLELHGIRFRNARGTVISVDTLRLAYRLDELLGHPLVVRRIALSGLIVDARGIPRPEPEPKGPPTDRRIERLDLDRVTLVAAMPGAPRDSVVTAHVRLARFRDMHFGAAFTLAIDSLEATADMPGIAAVGGWPIHATLAARGEVLADRVRIGALRVRTDASDLTLTGVVPLADRSLAGLDVVLDAVPLGGRDLGRVVPGTGLRGDFALHAFARSDSARTGFGLAARGRADGRVTLDGSLVMPRGGPVAGHARGVARRFDLADLLGGPRGTRVIEATLQADVAGDSLDRLDGPVTLDLAGTRYGGTRLDDARLDARFTAGRAALTTRLSSGALAMEATGWTRPFDATPAGELNARLDLPAIHLRDETSPLVYSGGAALALAFRGVSDSSRTGSLRVTLDPAPDRPMLLTAGDGEAHWHGSGIDTHAGVLFAGGSIETDAGVTLGRELGYRMLALKVRGVEPALLMGMRSTSGHETPKTGPAVPDTTSGAATASTGPNGAGMPPFRIDADLAFEGRGTAPASMRIDARLASFELRRGDRRLARGQATATIQRGTLTVDAGAALDTGTVELNGTLGFATRERILAVTEMEGHARLGLHDARWAGRTLASGETSVDLAAGALRFDGALATDAGHATWAGHARPFDPTPSVDLERLTLDGVQPGVWTGHPEWPARLDGHLEGSLRGSNPDSLDAAATCDLAGSRLGPVTFDRLDGRFRIEHHAWNATLDGRSPVGSTMMTAAGRLDPDSLRVVSHGRLEVARLGALVGRDSLAGHAVADFDVAGSLPPGGALDGADLRLVLEGNARLGQTRLDTIRVAGLLHDSMLSIARLELSGAPVSIHGGGTVPLPSARSEHVGEFHVDLDGDHLARLGPAIGVPSLSSGPVRAHLEARGPSDGRDVRFALSALRASIHRVSADTIGVSGTMRIEGDRVTRAQARAFAGTVLVTGMVPRDLTGSLDWDGEAMRVGARSQVDATRYVDLGGRLWPAGRHAQLDRLDIHQFGTPLSLAHPVEIAYSDGIQVRDLMLVTEGRPELRLDGGLDDRGRIDARGSIEHLALDGPMQFVGLSALGGVLDASFEAGGTLDAPDAHGQLHLVLNADRKPLLSAEGHARWNGGRMTADLAVNAAKSGSMTLAADLPVVMAADSTGGRHVAFADGPLDGKLVFDGFDLAPFGRIVSPRVMRKLSGRLNGEARVGGTGAVPHTSGEITLEDGGVELSQLGAYFKQGSAHLALDGRTITLDRFALRSGAGRLDATGKLQLERGRSDPFELEARLDRFRVMDAPTARIAATGHVACAGTFAAPNVSGELTLEDGVIWLAGASEEKYETVVLTEDDLRELRTRFDLGMEGSHPSGSPDSLTLDMGVRVGQGMWFRSRSDPVLSLELKGDFRAHKDPGQPLRLAGNAGIVPGRSTVSFLGRRFEVTQAKVDLPGKVEDARATVEARYSSSSSQSGSDVEVTAFVTADANGTVIDLRSRPHLERDEILKFITTGQAPGRAGNAGGEDVAGLAMGWLLGTVGGAAGQSIGIDVVQVTQDAYGGQTMSAGTYVHPRVYLGIREPINSLQSSANGPGSTTLKTEYDVGLEALSRLLVQIQGNDQQTRIFLRPRLGR